MFDWLQTSPGGRGVFRCSTAEAISRSCPGRPPIPRCPSESGRAKRNVGTGPQADAQGRTASQQAVPGPEDVPCGSDRTGKDSGEYVPTRVCVCPSLVLHLEIFLDS